DTATLVAGTDVEIVELRLVDRCVADNLAIDLGDPDVLVRQHDASHPLSRLLIGVQHGQPRHRLATRRGVDLGNRPGVRLRCPSELDHRHPPSWHDGNTSDAAPMPEWYAARPQNQPF